MRCVHSDPCAVCPQLYETCDSELPVGNTSESCFAAYVAPCSLVHSRCKCPLSARLACVQPFVGPSGCIYSCCGYSYEEYYDTFKAVAPAVHAAFPATIIHANSWGGQQQAFLIAQDPSAALFVDGWTYHMVGADSNDQVRGSCALHVQRNCKVIRH